MSQTAIEALQSVIGWSTGTGNEKFDRDDAFDRLKCVKEHAEIALSALHAKAGVSMKVSYPDGVAGSVKALRDRADKYFKAKDDAACNELLFAADALEHFSALSTKLQEPVGLKLIPVAVKFLDEAFTEIRQWSGSAFLADEAVEDEAACKSQLYDFLCSHGNVIQSIADDLRTLAHQPVTAVLEKALEDARLFGAGYLMIKPDGTSEHIPIDGIRLSEAALKSEGRNDD